MRSFGNAGRISNNERARTHSQKMTARHQRKSGSPEGWWQAGSGSGKSLATTPLRSYCSLNGGYSCQTQIFQRGSPTAVLGPRVGVQTNELDA
jgi:hypothetical protein